MTEVRGEWASARALAWKRMNVALSVRAERVEAQTEHRAPMDIGSRFTPFTLRPGSGRTARSLKQGGRREPEIRVDGANRNLGRTARARYQGELRDPDNRVNGTNRKSGRQHRWLCQLRHAYCAMPFRVPQSPAVNNSPFDLAQGERRAPQSLAANDDQSVRKSSTTGVSTSGSWMGNSNVSRSSPPLG